MIQMLFAIICLLCLAVSWLWWRARRPQTPDPLQSAEDALSTLLAELRGRLDTLLTEKELRLQDLQNERATYKDLTTQWQERIASIESSLVRISTEASGKVEDMASQLKPILSIFRSPQTAGIEFGEAELEMILKTHLGEGLYLRKPQLLAVGQDVVDFAIKLPDCVVPIDSKFPSAQYRAWVEASEPEAKAAWRVFRDQLLRQMEATAKYIKPDTGTTDYALMFLPSDVIYQQAFLTQRVYEQENPIPQRSIQLQVFGCSPQTLMPIFSLIRLGLRNLKIAEDVKGIRSHIDELSHVFSRLFLEGDWETLRKHLKQLSDHAERMASEKGSLSRVRETVRKLTDLSREQATVAAPAPKTPEPASLFALQGGER